MQPIEHKCLITPGIYRWPPFSRTLEPSSSLLLLSHLQLKQPHAKSPENSILLVRIFHIKRTLVVLLPFSHVLMRDRYYRLPYLHPNILIHPRSSMRHYAEVSPYL